MVIMNCFNEKDINFLAAEKAEILMCIWWIMPKM
jgi:hypothetical protein